MRQILFRGKIEGTNEWVYGSYIRDKFNHMIQDDEFNTWAVDGETVGQFTGFKDQNDIFIYDSDIIKVMDGNLEMPKNDSDTGIGCVMFLPNYGLWYINKVNNGLGDLSMVYYFEVIGNKFDNPELLEE